jgi:mRNA interferase RelE/StbE
MPEPTEGVSLSRYRIFETDQFLRSLEELGATEREFVVRKSRDYPYPQLAAEPHFGVNIKRLLRYVPPTWRYRIGRFRLFYLVDEKERIVFLLSLDHRKDAYK